MEDALFETERFIDEIKVRKSLWDHRSEDYKNRVLKKNQWIEVCLLVSLNFNDLDAKGKAQFCK